MKNKYKKYSSKSEREAQLLITTIKSVTTTITKEGKIKNDIRFPFIESIKCDTCIYWSRFTAKAGDTVQFKGRFKNGIFAAWSYMILKHSPAPAPARHCEGEARGNPEQ